MDSESKLWRPPPRRPYKPRDARVTSSMMSAVRREGNKAEGALRRELWRRGLRYRLQLSGLTGRPDIVFSRPKVAIFVDGDFWHGRGLIEDGEEAFRATMRTERREWWITKLKKNVARDTYVTRSLAESGWLVIRVWESDVDADAATVARRIASIVRRRVRDSKRAAPSH